MQFDAVLFQLGPANDQVGAARHCVENQGFVDPSEAGRAVHARDRDVRVARPHQRTVRPVQKAAVKVRPAGGEAPGNGGHIVDDATYSGI